VIPAAELLPAVSSGTVQFAITAAPQIDIGALKSKIRLIGEWTPHSNESYIATGAIKTPADLKGKTITSSAPGSSTNVLTLYMLKQHGLSANDVHSVDLAGSALVDGAWKSGRVVGTVQSQPGLGLFLSQLPGSHVLEDFASLNFTGAEIAANQSYLTSHKSAVLGLIRGLNAALQTWWSHPATAKNIIVANGGSAATAQAAYDSTTAVFQKNVSEISLGQEQAVFRILHSVYDPSITVDEASKILAPGYVTEALNSK
jgi:ABC-type nitrate/sulfonate/bicarbonate transport system substrate-binding protein